MNADLILSNAALAKAVAVSLAAAGIEVHTQSLRQPVHALDLADLVGDVLIVESSKFHEMADLKALEALTFSRPQLYVILITDNADKTLLFGAMRAGVREVLNLPLADDALSEAFKRCASHQIKLQESPDNVRSKAKMAAFVSCKGGNGASFVATNMAYLIASEFSKSCAFLDLDLQYGDASFYLGGGSVKNNISDLTQQIERLDGQLLFSCMHQVAPGLVLLAAPHDIETALSVTAKQLEKVLQLARQRYEVVLLDIHRAMDGLAIQSLDMADVVYLVMDNTMPSVRDAKRLVKLFRTLAYSDEKLRVLVNRYNSKGFVDIKSIEAAIGLRVTQTLPEHFDEVSESINLGQPLVKMHPKNPVVDALRLVAANFLQTEPPKNKTWLSRWVGAHA
jgi:pilus assembly protein CpaE